MAWAAVAVGVVGAATSYMSAKKQAAAAKAAAQAASGPTTTTREPWGPSVGYREQIMAGIMGQLPGGAPAVGGAAAGPSGGAQQPAIDPAAFEKIISGDAGIPEKGRAWLIGMAKNAAAGDPNARAGLTDALSKMKTVSPATRTQLSSMLGPGIASAPPGGGGGGGHMPRLGGGGGGGGNGGGSASPDYNKYINDILGQQFSANPYIDSVVAAMHDNYAKEYGQINLAAEAGDAPEGATSLERAMALDRLGKSEGAVRYQDYNDWRNNKTAVLGIGTDFEAKNRATAAQRAVGMANVGVARAGLAFDKFKYNDMAPFQKYSMAANVIDQMSGGYGTTTQQGPQQAPAYTQDPWSAAAQGGLSAWALAKQWGGSGSGSSGSLKPNYNIQPLPQTNPYGSIQPIPTGTTY